MWVVVTAVCAIVAALAAMAPIVRAAVRGAVQPELAAIHARIDEHMMAEEAELAKANATSGAVGKSLDSVHLKLDELANRQGRTEVDVAYLRGAAAREGGAPA